MCDSYGAVGNRGMCLKMPGEIRCYVSYIKTQLSHDSTKNDYADWKKKNIMLPGKSGIDH